MKTKHCIKVQKEMIQQVSDRVCKTMYSKKKKKSSCVGEL